MLCIMGVGVLLYPAASQWNSARVHARTVYSYGDAVSALPGSERNQMLEAARAYNASLTGTPPPDPYTASGPADPGTQGELDTYTNLLNVEQTMGRLRIPTIDVDLPIYHGTSPQTLDRGVGHLFGSALPVGGPSTHTVMTAHSGIPEAQFFNRLSEVLVGDDIVVDVLGEQLVYRVTSTQIVLPTQVDSLVRVAGQDLLTLITCTPYAVNTHRLLVHAARIDREEETAKAAHAADAVTSIPFPWWMIVAGATLVGAGALVVLPPWRARRNSRGGVA